MANLTKLFKIETSKNKTYFFDSLSDATSFSANNKAIFKTMNVCYGEMHEQEGIPFYYLAQPEVELDLTPHSLEVSCKITAHQYTFDAELLKKKSDSDNFVDVMDRVSSEHEGVSGPYGDTIHHISEKKPEMAYQDHRRGEYYYQEKILLISNETLQLYSVDRQRKILVGEKPQEVETMDPIQYMNFFREKRAKLFNEMNSKKSEIIILDGKIQAMESEYGRGIKQR